MTTIDQASDFRAQRAPIGERIPPLQAYEDPIVYEQTAYSSPGTFPAGALNTPMFEGKDVAGLIAAVAITLGPLAAYSFGWGA